MTQNTNKTTSSTSNSNQNNSHFALIDTYESESDLSNLRSKSWNNSHSTLDHIKHQRPRARFLDCSDPKVAYEAFRNIADVHLARTCSWVPHRVDKDLVASVERFGRICDSFSKHNQLDYKAYREGARIEYHINPITVRKMDMSHPCLQGRWNNDWANPASMAKKQSNLGRMEQYAKDRDAKYAELELGRVAGLSKGQMERWDAVARMDKEYGTFPPLTVERDCLFFANSRARFPFGLSRVTSAPQSGKQVMRLANRGLSHNASSYTSGKPVTGC